MIRLGGADLVFPCIVIYHAIPHRHKYHTGTDSIHPDSLPRKLNCQRLGQTDHTKLTGAIGGLASVPPFSRLRGHIDSHPGLTEQHLPNGGTTTIKGTC